MLLAIAGLSPLGNVLIFPLEQRFPAWDASARRARRHRRAWRRGHRRLAAARNDVALNEAAERMTATVELARRYPDARIIFSRRRGSARLSTGNEAEVALRLFERLGIAPGRVEPEDQSRNTVENALFSKRIAAPKPGERWLLVTSAYHMPRAIGRVPAGWVFQSRPIRSTGVHAASRTHGGRFARWPTGCGAPTPRCANGSGSSIYWLTGQSSELFPVHPR